jgi:hypothetical protein
MITADYQPTYFAPKESMFYQRTSGHYRTGNELPLYNSELYQELQRQNILKNAISDYFKQNLEKRALKIAQSFEKKLKFHLAAFEETDLRSVRASAALSTIFCLLTNPEKIGLDLTDEPSVFITLVYPNGKNAYLEFFIEAAKTEPVQHNIIIYEHKKVVFAYSGGFLESLEEFLIQIPPAPIEIPL